MALLRRFRSLSIIFVLTLSSAVIAQSGTCPELVAQAVEFLSRTCEDAARNQACYGNLQVEAMPVDSSVELQFSEPGDIANLFDIATLNLSSMITPDEWGVALLRVQANLPDTLPGQNVTMLLFGDVAIENEGSSVPTLSGVTGQVLNARSGAANSYRVVGYIRARETVSIDGRNQAGTWLRIVLEDGGAGWVMARSVTVDGDIAALPVLDEAFIDPLGRQYGPMQAFTFSSGIGASQCQEAPRDGILIQSPEGTGMIELLINEVKIELGSTIFVQASPNETMTIDVIEGSAIVTAQGATVMATAGSRAQIPLGSDGRAAGAPQLDRYTEDIVQSLPIVALPETIEIAAPLTDEAFEELQTTTIPGWWIVDLGPEVRITCDPSSGYTVLTHDGQLGVWSIAFVEDSIVIESGNGTFFMTKEGAVLRGSIQMNASVRDEEMTLTAISQTEISGTIEYECPQTAQVVLTYAGQQQPQLLRR